MGSRPIWAAIVFGHADFADDADFSSWEGFVPQISQIYTDIYWDVFLVTQISQMTQIFSHGIFLFIGRHGIYSEVSC